METLKKYLSPRLVCEFFLLLIIGILLLNTPNNEERQVLDWYYHKKTYVETAETLNATLSTLTEANDQIEEKLPLLKEEAFQ